MRQVIQKSLQKQTLSFLQKKTILTLGKKLRSGISLLKDPAYGKTSDERNKEKEINIDLLSRATQIDLLKTS